MKTGQINVKSHTGVLLHTNLNKEKKGKKLYSVTIIQTRISQKNIVLMHFRNEFLSKNLISAGKIGCGLWTLIGNTHVIRKKK